MHGKIAAVAAGATFVVTAIAQHQAARSTPIHPHRPLQKPAEPLTETPEAIQLRSRLRAMDTGRARHAADSIQEETIRDMVHAIFR